jgi:hypothetical protein
MLPPNPPHIVDRPRDLLHRVVFYAIRPSRWNFGRLTRFKVIQDLTQSYCRTEPRRRTAFNKTGRASVQRYSKRPMNPSSQ